MERRWQTMKKRTIKCIAVAVGAATGAAAVKTVRNTLNNLADIAMNRNLTENNEQILFSMAKPASAKELEMNNRRTLAAEQLRKSEYSTVTIFSYDGIRLIGHLHLVENPRRTIIAVHGWRSSWDNDFGVAADFLYSNECNVLYIEQRAHGASEGNYIGFGLLERYDVLAWIEWMNEQEFSHLPVYLFGMSMGAATVLMAAGEHIPDNIHGVIADSGYTSPRDEWKYLAENGLHYNYRVMEKYLDNRAMERTGFLPDEYSSTEAMQECKIPVLFIHGTEDSFVPIEMTFENYKACAEPKCLLVVPGAGHCQSYLIAQKRYEKELLQFWQEFDKANPES